MAGVTVRRRRLGLATMGLLVTTASLMTGPVPLDAQEVDLSEIGYVLGDTAAPIAVVEFGDFACGACAEFWRDSWPQVRTELVETRRVVWRHVPFLLGFRRGEDATKAAECAGEQSAFWPMHDRLFRDQGVWTEGGNPRDLFQAYAEEMGLDGEAFRTCFGKNHGKDRTRAANRAARSAGVRATPAFFIGGRQALGALSFAQFLALVEEAERVRR